MSKVYYEETLKNETKHVLIGPGNSCSINFCNLQGKHPCGSFFYYLTEGSDIDFSI